MTTLNPLEMQLTAICYETNTPDKCKKAMIKVRNLEVGADMKEKAILRKAGNSMLSKGHLLLLEGRA